MTKELQQFEQFGCACRWMPPGPDLRRVKWQLPRDLGKLRFSTVMSR